MEVTGLLLGTGQALIQIAGVVKRHVTSCSALRPIAESIEEKATRSCAIAIQISSLSQIPGVGGELFRQAHHDLEIIKNDFGAISQKIERLRRLRLLFLMAPSLLKSLEDLEKKFDQVEQYLRNAGTTASLISELRTDMREIVSAACSSILSITGSDEQVREAIINFETRLQESAILDVGMGSSADFAYTMGLASYDSKPDKLRIVTTSVTQAQKAARYFHRACTLGKKEAFRYYGDIFYDGKAVECNFVKAVEIYEQGVELEDAGSTFALGWCFEYGLGVDQSSSRALELYAKAIEGGCGEAMANMSHLKLHGKHTSANHLEATRLLKKAVSMDVFYAKDNLAHHYSKGVGYEKNSKKAFELFREVFYAGDLFATVDLADCYDMGLGVDRNPREATKVYERSLEANVFPSVQYQGYYGIRLIRGIGIEKDEARGMELVLEATKFKSATPWQALGDCYRFGYGVRQNKKLAKKFYRRAISYGNGIEGLRKAYMALGEMFETGEGVRPDVRRASKYYLAAADRFTIEGQWKSALAFETGLGLTRNIDRAVFYFFICANAGHREAQNKYVTYYTRGHGVERSRANSRKVLEQAAKAGNIEAQQLLRRESRTFKKRK